MTWATEVLTSASTDLPWICSLAQHDTWRRVIEYIRIQSTSSNSLLTAYILACSGRPGVDSEVEADLNDAQRFYGMGTRLLRDRLISPETASSDENIQAVLLLIAYASDTGSMNEVPIHVSALERMIRQRGGLGALENEIDSTLMLQLRAISRSRQRHLTLDCEAGCAGQLRFPQGLEFLDLPLRTQNVEAG